MLLLFIILLIVVFILLILLIISYEEEKYHRQIDLSPSSEQFEIGPLKYKIQNKSKLTYKHLGYLGNTGNQLFEITATLAIGYRNKCKVVFPSIIKTLSIYKMFDLSHLPIEDVECDDRILEFDNYEEITIPNDGRVYNLEGYRQSYLYFEPINNYLQDLFPLRDFSPGLKSKEKYIAVHIRRSDFINPPFLQKLFDLQLNCSFDYYRSAIQRIRKENHLSNNMKVIVVTDDPQWIKQHLHEIDPYATLPETCNKNNDFVLMYQAPYLVISNSTFSLWAAFLGNHKQIIAPSYWWPSTGMTAQTVSIHRQPICRPSWDFNDPITGKLVEKSYNWNKEDWSTPYWVNRTARAIFATNIFRKKT